MPARCHASSRPCWPPSWPRRSTTLTGSSRSSGTVSAWRPSSRAARCGSGPAASRTRAATSDRSSRRRRGSPARDAIVDGEVIALDDRGEPDFALLQARIKGQGQIGTPTPFVYEVFDLLWLDGRSLLDEPLETRRRLLAEASATRSQGAPERAHHRGWDRLLRGRPGPRARGDHGQGSPLALRARRALDGLAEGQDPAGAGARRGRDDPRDRQGRRSSVRCSSACTRTARCATQARSVPGSTTGSAPSCWRPSSRSSWTRRRSPSRHRAPCPGARSGCGRKW